jgi:hypothetical protein
MLAEREMGDGGTRPPAHDRPLARNFGLTSVDTLVLKVGQNFERSSNDPTVFQPHASCSDLRTPLPFFLPLPLPSKIPVTSTLHHITHKTTSAYLRRQPQLTNDPLHIVLVATAMAAPVATPTPRRLSTDASNGFTKR